MWRPVSDRGPAWRQPCWSPSVHSGHGGRLHHVGRDDGHDARSLHVVARALGATDAGVDGWSDLVDGPGVRLSTTAVGMAVVAQVAIMLVVCAVVLVDERGHLSSAPFSWAHLSGGLTGLSRGFPWRSTCSSAGRTARPSPKSAATRNAPFESPVPLDRDRRRAVRVLRVRDRHRVPLRRLVHREVLVPFLTVADNSSAKRPSWPGSPGSCPSWQHWSPAAAHNRACSSTEDGQVSCRHGSGASVHGSTRGERAGRHDRDGPRHHRGLGGIHVLAVGTGSMNPVGLYAECSTMARSSSLSSIS